METTLHICGVKNKKAFEHCSGFRGLLMLMRNQPEQEL